MRTFLFAIFLFFIFDRAFAQEDDSASCPTGVEVMQDFDINKYLGLWYEIEKTPMPFEAGQKCITANYTDKGDYISVLNKGISKRSGREKTAEGKGTIPNPTEPAKIKVQFGVVSFSADYWILDTDYDEYAVVYSCFNLIKGYESEFVWILSRSPSLSEVTKNKAYKLLKDYNVNLENLRTTIQDC